MNTEERIKALEDQLRLLQNTVNAFMLTSLYAFQRDIAIADGRTIRVGTDNGTKIGTTASQKIGFLGATPVVQQAGIAAPSGGSTIDTQARSAVTSIISVLQAFGLTA